MKTFWDIVFPGLLGLGGAGVIILFVGNWLANRIAESLLKKMEFLFSRELKGLKAQADKKGCISKARFDLEVEVYRQLSEAIMDMASHSDVLIDCGLADIERKQKKKFLSKATASYNRANRAIFRNSSFVPKDMHELFDGLRKDCGNQLDSFRFILLHENAGTEKPRDLEKEKEDAVIRAQKINESLDFLFEKLRTHVKSLDVFDR